MLQTAQFLRQCALPIDSIFHSDRFRAKQTAEIVAKEYSSSLPLYERKDIGPNDPIHSFIEKLVSFENKQLMIVSHLPFLTDLMTFLLFQKETPPFLNLKTSACVCLEQNETWKIAWMIEPAFLPKAL